MHIGILTLYKVRNIGAGLQAMAMERVLEDRGCRVSFIDGYDAAFARQLFKNDMGRIWPWKIPFLMQKDYKFRKFFRKFPQVEFKISKGLDGIIIGSDSLWLADYGKLPTPTAFFGDIDNRNVCAYAPSVGGRYNINKYTRKQLESLKKIRYITVRDSSSQQFIHDVLGFNCPIVVDPTLLYDWHVYLHEIGNRVKNSDYILLYGQFNRSISDKIKQFAKREGLSVINIGTFNRHFRTNVAASPDDFIRYLDRAQYVITSMFHGVMLSVAFHKEFRYISADPNRDIKTETLVNKLRLNSVMLQKESINDLSDIFSDKIEYAKTQILLDELKTESNHELDKILDMMGKGHSKK